MYYGRQRTKQSSIRYSERFAEIVNSYPGKSFNDKLENLVLFCFDEVPKVEARLKDLEERTKEQRQEFYEMSAKVRDVSSLRDTLNMIEKYGTRAAELLEAMAEESEDKSKNQVEAS